MTELNGNHLQAQDRVDAECWEFQTLMAERIGAGEDLQSYPHMQTCEYCKALVLDLEQLAEAVRFALKKQEVEPDPAVWDRLKEAIEHEEA